MTLSSRHRIRISSPGGLRPSTLPLGHGSSPQYWLSHVDGEETFFCFFQTAETGNRTPNSGVKGSGANHYPRAPALRTTMSSIIWDLTIKSARCGSRWRVRCWFVFFFVRVNTEKNPIFFVTTPATKIPWILPVYFGDVQNARKDENMSIDRV